MLEMQIGDQLIRYDRDRTISIYAGLERGGCDECDCVFCKNFAAERHAVYPPSFKALLNQLGIDPDKEGEVYECMPVKDGLHLYQGWLYFVGELASKGQQTMHADDSPYFEYFVGTSFPKAPAFQDSPYLALEFSAHVKWVIPENPESGRRTAN
jgi:hypothetical protein